MSTAIAAPAADPAPLWRGHKLGRRDSLRAHRIDPHRTGDVLDLLLAAILERVGQLVANLIADDTRYADAGRIGERLEPRRDIDAVAEDVVILGDDVAEVDADAEFEPPLGGDIAVARGHLALHPNGATHRIDDAGELDKEPVAGGFDDPPVTFAKPRVGDLMPPGAQPGKRSVLVLAHQPGIAGDVGRQDCR